MTLDDLKALIEAMTADPTSATDEKLAEATDAIREIVAAQAGQTPSPDTIAVLTDVKAAKAAIVGEQTARAEATAAVNSKAERLLAELAEPQPEGVTDGATDGEPVATETEQAPEPALAASAGRGDLDATMAGFLKAMQHVMAGQPASVQAGSAPQGRSAGRIGGFSTQPVATPTETAIGKVYVGANAAQGSPISSNLAMARAIHDRWRGAYQAASFTGRLPVIHVDTQYPDSRTLGTDESVNYQRIEAATAPQSLVAAGGLCAPLDTLYDVEVIGSAARPIRDSALAKFAVERGGITFRPNTSAAAAVHGAGVWTLGDDAAGTGEKACYQVDCPGMEEEVIEAIYLCLEFSNITSRFDPETTASNVQQGMIAHARLAENRLLSKMAAGSKLLTGAKVIGAVRDLLVNVDKTTAYYRNRHRLDAALPLTWLAPGWVKSLIRADLARQMAAGDWAEALAPADSLIDGWFSARGVTPVWHMDGMAGTDEVQTVTITGTPTGGTFTLTFAGQTTTPIAFSATAAAVRTALAGLSNLAAEDVAVAGGPGPGTPYTVTFSGGAVDGRDVPQMTATGSFTGGTTPAVAVTTTAGGGGALTVNGVSIVSQTYGDAAAGGAIPGFPDQIDSLLFAPGSWLFLDGGSLDLGLVRDSTLNAKNRYRQFSETFEGAAHRGIESLRLVMEVQPTGQTSGTKDLSAIVD